MSNELVPDDALTDGSPAKPDCVLEGKIEDLPLTGKVVPSLDELVKRWKEADKAAENATWEKADVALDAVVADKNNHGLVKAFAERVGVPLPTVNGYRVTATAWPRNLRGTTSYAAARALAERIGTAASAVVQYRYLAKAWPISTRAYLSVRVAKAFVGQGDRFELVANRSWTFAEAMRQAGEMAPRRGNNPKGLPTLERVVGVEYRRRADDWARLASLPEASYEAYKVEAFPVSP